MTRIQSSQRPQQLWVDRFPPDLRRQLKSLAALRGITLRDAMIEAAAQWCAAEREKREREEK